MASHGLFNRRSRRRRPCWPVRVLAGRPRHPGRSADRGRVDVGQYPEQSALGALLGPPFDLGFGGPGGWWIDDEPELSLTVDPDFDPVIPDLAGWRVETMPDHDGPSARFHTVPDWVCEILAPSTARRDRVLEVPFYARAGVGHMGLVDPAAETLEVFRLDGPGWRLVQSAGGDAVVRGEPFDAIELPLAYLWRTSKAAPSEADP